VAKHLSFTKAAEALFMTQPAVTFQIRQLEEQLNTRLFDRAQGRISLTFAGTIALEYADRILALSEELDSRMKELSGQFAGPLLIGASTTIADFLQMLIAGRSVCVPIRSPQWITSTAPNSFASRTACASASARS
jgi:DNA-binding transcriptional LysR family regulator